MIYTSCKDCSNINNSLITSAAYMKSVLWPRTDRNGNPTNIKVSFLSNGNNLEWTPLGRFSGMKIYNLEKELNNKVNGKVAVTRAVKEILQPIIGINFEFVNDLSGDIIIGFDPDEGSYSVLGKPNSNMEKTMNFGWLDIGTIIHEFLHALGAVHEHQNPYENPIKWDTEKVYEYTRRTQGWDKETTDTNIFEQFDKESLNASNFDIDSIMLYFFPEEFTLDNKATKQNFVLSKTDIEWLYNIYPKNDSTIDEIVDVNTDIISNENVKNIDIINRYTKTIIIIIIIVLIILTFIYLISYKKF